MTWLNVTLIGLAILYLATPLQRGQWRPRRPLREATPSNPEPGSHSPVLPLLGVRPHASQEQESVVSPSGP